MSTAIKANETTDLLKANLYGFVKSERMRYDHIYKIIETYVIEHKLFISDPYKLTHLETNTDQFMDFHYSIYCSRPLEHANAITNLIYEELMVRKDPLIDLLVMNTAIKNEEFSISYDNRFIVKVYALQRDRPKGQSSDLAKLIIPEVINKVPYMPAEIEIIDVYNNLYTNPTNLYAYEHFESSMLKQVLSKIGGEVQDISGGDNQGGNIISGADDSQKNTCYERKKDELEALKIAIVKDFLPGKPLALLGPMAIELYQSGTDMCPKYDRIQLVGTWSTSELKTKLSDYLTTFGRRYEISDSDELDLLIPKDFRTKRVIFSMSIKTDMGIKEKPFLEYFNSCNFELIPVFEFENILLTNKYVLLRFLFIDLWVTKFIYSIGKLEKSSYVSKQQRTMSLIRLASKMPFVVDGLIGSYYDFEISKKEKKIDQEQYFGPYYPAGYFKKNSKLRTV